MNSLPVLFRVSTHYFQGKSILIVKIIYMLIKLDRSLCESE